MDVEVRLEGQHYQFNLLIIDGDGPILLGRDWLNKLRINWSKLNQVRHSDELQRILDNHFIVFKEELGCIEGI